MNVSVCPLPNSDERVRGMVEEVRGKTNGVTAEMVCYMPVPAPFVRFGGEWVDEALGFAMGWNFYLNMGIILPSLFSFLIVDATRLIKMKLSWCHLRSWP
jgi:hypothetical protein